MTAQDSEAVLYDGKQRDPHWHLKQRLKMGLREPEGNDA